MRTGKINFPTKTSALSGKDDLEIRTMFERESAAILTEYDELITAIKSVN